MSSWKYSTPGIPDSEFIRGDIPMTKEEIRALTITKLRLAPNQNFLDIGAGTGSISIEAAILGCNVISIEKRYEGITLIHKNIRKFKTNNIKTIEGSAPEDLCKKQKFQRIFIGGSGGNLGEIFTYIDKNLDKNGIVVANTITLENQFKILKFMKEYNFKDIEYINVNISRGIKVGSIHMNMAENPITIISGKKRGNNHEC